MVSLSKQILSNPTPGLSGPDGKPPRKPKWLKMKLPGGDGYQELRQIVDHHELHTVCESAKCPNMGECWSRGTATLMILGDVCTRSCGFCHIETGRPPILDLEEPRRVGEAVALMKLKHLVITSVNRDELPDGGASIWAQTMQAIRQRSAQTSIEVLIPDFCGDEKALQLVLDEKPEILNHNMETVPRLYSVVRPQAKYEQSLELLRRSKAQNLTTKTGIMVGIGETDDEIDALMQDLVAKTTTEFGSCDILTIGQYLQPTREHLPVARWVTPEQFVQYKRQGEALGIKHVESGPLVRSSYHAEDQVLRLNATSTA